MHVTFTERSWKAAVTKTAAMVVGASGPTSAATAKQLGKEESASRHAGRKTFNAAVTVRDLPIASVPVGTMFDNVPATVRAKKIFQNAGSQRVWKEQEVIA